MIHATATSDDVDFTAVLGNTVTKDQTDWSLVLALPRSQMGQFVRGELSSFGPSAVQSVALSKILHSCDWCTCTGKEWTWTLRRTSHCW